VLLDPDNVTMRHNLACDMVVHRRDFDAAVELLAPVLKKTGTEQLEWLKSDPDLDPLRNDARFQAMIAEAEQRLANTSA
jgi:adenylate cyclase